MTSSVYFGSAHQTRMEAKETLPAKLDLILDRLGLRDRVKGERVLIKMHTGNNINYSTIPPLFVRKVVERIMEGGGKPFIADVYWDVEGAEKRGYSQEMVGCPVYPAAGIDEKYCYSYVRPFKNLKEWKLAGMVNDATFLVNFAHVKGHPSCGFGAAIKNLALGCMVTETRSAMHDSCHFDRYWFPERCPELAVREKIRAACPFEALVEDKEHPGELHLHFEQCNQCGRCLKVAPAGSLRIDRVNFDAFQEACAISTAITLSTFAPGKSLHLNLATDITPLCDCFGFTTLPILPDVGVLGSDDVVALEQATLDLTASLRLMEENLPPSLEVFFRQGHPFRQLHGPLKDPYRVLEYAEALGIGSRKYDLVDVLPLETIARAPIGYVSAS
jgi:uncharacterized Fe-S center protein